MATFFLIFVLFASAATFIDAATIPDSESPHLVEITDDELTEERNRLIANIITDMYLMTYGDNDEQADLSFEGCSCKDHEDGNEVATLVDTTYGGVVRMLKEDFENGAWSSNIVGFGECVVERLNGDQDQSQDAAGTDPSNNAK